MKHYRLFPFALGIFLLFGANAFGEPVHASSSTGAQPRKSGAVAEIAGGGEARMQVVVHPGASEEIRQAAAEVAVRLGQMSGGEFEVVEGDGSKGIVIGSLEQFPDEGISAALAPFGGVKWVDGLPIATDTGEDGVAKWGAVEAFAIRTEPDRVRLLGNTERGGYLAASRFLELLGVRQLTMSRNWLIVPEKSDVLFDAEEEQVPSFYLRDIWFSHGTPNTEWEGEPMGDRDRWRFYNRWGGAFESQTNHMTGTVIRQNREELDANKERFYAKLPTATEDNPWPGPGKLNMSEPRVREMITEVVLDSFTARDGTPRFMSSAEPSDGGNWCIRPESEAMGSISDRAFYVANEVARAAAEKYPHRMVGHLAYFLHADPPSFDLEPNLFVYFCTYPQNFASYPEEDLIELWAKKTPLPAIREYLSTFVWGQDRIRDPGAYAPAASAPGMAELVRKYYDLGYRFFRAESCLNFAIYGPGYYMGFQMLWDVESDENAIMNDYLEKAFGPAEEPMRKFYELMDPRSGRLTHRNFYARLVEYLDQATELAKGNSAVLARLDELKSFMVVEYLRYKVSLVGREDEDLEERKALDFRILEQIYRNRDTHMNHYTAIRSNVRVMARRYEEPSWVEGRLGGNAVWQQKEPPTSEETAELFAEVREFFRPLQVEERDFGTGIQVVDLSAQRTAVESSGDNEEPFEVVGNTRGRTVMHLKSEDGEPLQFGVSFAEVRRERFPVIHTRIWVRDAEGNLIHREAREQKQGEALTYELEIPIPGPGEYVVEASQRRVRFQPQGTAIPFHRGVNHLGSGITRYFYVPEETETLWMYPGSSSNIPLVAPDGTRLDFEVDENRLAHKEIPAEWRGKIWSTEAAHNFRFLNVPNLFFYDPARALIPASVEKKL